MKQLTLMVSLLAPLHALANSCLEMIGFNSFHVDYVLFNQSKYWIGLYFDEARHGENPDYDIELAPHGGKLVSANACSSSLVTGYETRATLKAYPGSFPESYGNKAGFDLAYLYVGKPYRGDGEFSFDAYDIKSPECFCYISVGYDGDFMSTYDCSSYAGPMARDVKIHIYCK